MQDLVLPTLEEVDKALAEKSLVEFVRQAFHVVEPSTDYVHGWHIDAICEHLEAVTRGDIKRLIINVPPGHMKSLICGVFWPAWTWATRPETRWIAAAYEAGLSRRDSIKARNLIGSDWYRERWGNVLNPNEVDTQTEYHTTAGGFRFSTSVNGAATGRHAHIQLVDDPLSAGDALSKAAREACTTWWRETMSSRLLRGGARVIIQQRLHQDDLAGVMLREGGYEHLKLPAFYEPYEKKPTSIGWVDPRTEEGAPLWPENYEADEQVRRKKELGTYGFVGQYQQRPDPPGGAIIQRAWVKHYSELPGDATGHTQSWDAAFKDKATSDFVVGQVWAKAGANYYLIDQVRDRMAYTATKAAVTSLSAKHPRATKKLIEDKANGPAIIDELKGSIPGIVPITPKGSKEERVHAVSPLFEAGNVYLPDPSRAPWVHDFVEELVSFPFAPHDDQVDACTQYLLNARSGFFFV